MDKLIFLLNSPYPYYTGGRETWINNVANRLIDSYEITILTVDHCIKDNDTNRWVIDPRIKIIPIKSLLSVCKCRWFMRSYIVYFHTFIISYLMKSALKKNIEKTQKTFVISMDTVFLPLANKGIKEKYSQVTTIISSRGNHSEVYSSYWPLAKKQINKIEIKNLRNSDMIWSNGYDTQKQLYEKGFDSTVIFNGVDCQYIYSTDLPIHNEFKKYNGIRIVTIGTLLDIKGYPTMIEAIELIKQKISNKDVHLFAFGKGDPRKYADLAKAHNVEGNIHFIGEDKNAPLYAKEADVLLALTTKMGGGMSMAALEMMATGVPVIANNNQCYTQLIQNGKDGFLVEEGNPENLAEMIMYVSNLDKDTKKQIGEKAFLRTKENDWDNVVYMVKKELEP